MVQSTSSANRDDSGCRMDNQLIAFIVILTSGDCFSCSSSYLGAYSRYTYIPKAKSGGSGLDQSIN